VNEKSACVAHFPLDALIVNNCTIAGNWEVSFWFARRSAGRAIVISCCTVFPAARAVSK